jgi:hypothetical protein
MIIFIALTGALFIFGLFETLRHLLDKNEKHYFRDVLLTSVLGGLLIFLVFLQISE